MTNEQIKKRVEDIKDRAPIAALQEQSRKDAIADEFKARGELLKAALEASRPAWNLLANKLPVLQSRQGCREHGIPGGTDRRGDLVGVQILPNVAVAWQGLGGPGWAFYLDRDPFLPGRCGCYRFDWRPLSADVLLAEVSLSDLVEGLAQALEEQITGRRVLKTLHIQARANRLRAVALLAGAVEVTPK
jgi:hypothetical protein